MNGWDGVLLFLMIWPIYTYFGYPFILWLWPNKKKLSSLESFKPTLSVSVIIAAYNEEDFIEDTLRSILASDYPSQLLKVWVISDASTDNTDNLVKSFSTQVILLSQKKRGGKREAMEWGIEQAQSDILVLADASSHFEKNTLKVLLAPFQDSSIGSVVGKKTILPSHPILFETDGLYWRYESKLKELESETGALWTGCEGGLTALRRDLLRLDYSKKNTEDVAMCARMYEQGFRNVHEPKAIFWESPSLSMGHEFSRKIRVSAAAMGTLFRFGYLLNPFKHPLYSFQNISHRLMRWSIPWVLIALFFFSCWIDTPLSTGLFWAQCLFYCTAIFGMFLNWKMNLSLPKIFSIPFYFCAMNLSALIAWTQLWRDWTVYKRSERISRKGDGPT
jgi:cellulose synthase/poly-beta-1,6-N-acetylglucosamine synthase-like glycosyltransferase